METKIQEAIDNLLEAWDGPQHRPLSEIIENEIEALREFGSENQRKERLEYLRTELRAERISYEEIHELQNLAEYIDPSDVELLEAAGVPES